ncbi:HlyD family type I secretion periplasmic adaptor subunit [Balneatrix alpica]|uniref:Membrane fusion protein (MFP) family protein n=1 Tax=Balneatrix alpica TaxID=75684 RepID=A0ABV5ZDY9_9GAMM|nr:HlyD family type I secretion periplasmic adaptor subunit [Balneatrix alpica]
MKERMSDQDLAFAADLKEALYNQQVQRWRGLFWLIIAMLLVVITWAYWAELDEITRGTGKVIPSNQLQVVQNLEGGIVSEILVKEGEMVTAGQVLLRIDDTRFNASFEENQQRFLALEAKIARLQAEAEGKEFAPDITAETNNPYLRQEYSLYQIRLRSLQEQIGILESQIRQRERELDESKSREAQVQRGLNLVERELTMTRPLAKSGVVSEVELLRLEREVNDIRGELSSLRITIPRLQAAIEEAKQKRSEAQINFRREARAELTETSTEHKSLSELLKALDDQVKRTAVRAPVDGRVQRLLVNTRGGVVQPGMSLIELVPIKDLLIVEAKIKPSDIAYLHPGQQAVVRFSAYDFAIYGGLEAELTHISPDTVHDEQTREDFYMVRLATKATHLGSEEKPLPIIPGMVVTVDIMTGKKTVLDYLLKPVYRAKETALRER